MGVELSPVIMEETSFGCSKNRVLRKISWSKMDKVTEGLRKQHTAELLDLQGSIWGGGTGR
jgi:hypothetical protein